MAKKKVTKQKQKQTQRQSVVVNIGTKKTTRKSSKKSNFTQPSGPVPITYQYLPRTVYYGDAATPATSIPISMPTSVPAVKPEVKTPIIRMLPRLPAGPPPYRNPFVIAEESVIAPPIELPVKADFSELQMPEPAKLAPQREVGASRTPFKFPQPYSEDEGGYITEAVTTYPVLKGERIKRQYIKKTPEQKAEEKRLKEERKLAKEAKKMSQG